MAKLSIRKRDIITPYNLSPIEASELVVTSSNRASVSRRGGFCFSLTMGIRPYSMIDKDDFEQYWRLVGELSRDPYLEVPLYNAIETDTFKAGIEVITPTASRPVGADTITVSTSLIMPGQIFRVDAKLYQAANVAGSTIFLSKPLSQEIDTSTQIVLSEDKNDHDGPDGYFVNEDFGNPVNRIEDGILGVIGPLQFKEKL